MPLNGVNPGRPCHVLDPQAMAIDPFLTRPHIPSADDEEHSISFLGSCSYAGSVW